MILINGIIKLHKLNNKVSGFFNDTLNACPELYNLLNSEKIISLAKTMLDMEQDIILGNNYRLRIQIPGTDKVSNLPWHQDSHYNKFYVKNSSIVIWSAINNIDDEAGPIIYKKGSHNVGTLTRKEFVRPNNQKVYTIPEEYINDKCYEECTLPVESGDVIVLDMNLIHKSGKNRSSDKVKLSVQGRYHNPEVKGFMSQYD